MLAVLIGLAMLWSCHPTASGKWLRRGLVERPAEWLSRVEVRHVVVVVLALVAVVGAFYLFEGEGLRLVGSGVAEGAAWFIALDVSTFLEVYAVLWLLGARRQVRAALESVRGVAAQAGRAMSRFRRIGARQASHPARREAPSPDNDPDPEGWLALAA
jgi:hypothetical protein